VLVSEVMLQQTQVHRVMPRFAAFLEWAPTPAALAERSLGDVLRMWQGLGYPRRARNLHLCAQRIVDGHDGTVPDQLETLLDLPGVGPYTARAVLAFAFGRDVGVVDVNIARVLARVTGERLGGRAVQTMADSLVPTGLGWEWNHVVMDLGATVCRARPLCEECPLGGASGSCAWSAAGHPEPDPAIGTAGVGGRQPRFEGSDRQARGRLVRRLGDGAIDESEAPRVMDRDAGVADRLVADLVREGLVERSGGSLRLPGSTADVRNGG
jgi:A/G-specific adenine glycosylase